MAQSIRRLTLGSKVKDNLGNKFIVIAHDHYDTNEVTLMAEAADTMKYNSSDGGNGSTDYQYTDLVNYLNNDYLDGLYSELSSAIKVSTIPYLKVSYVGASKEEKTIQSKVFILSGKELGETIDSKYSGWHQNEAVMPYMMDYGCKLYTDHTWTRTDYADIFSSKFLTYKHGTGLSDYHATNVFYVRPCFNLGSEVLVTDDAENGYYSFVFNAPPVIENIPNIEGNYGAKTDIEYVVADSDDAELTHHISFDNGNTYFKINPTRSGDRYTYSHVFSELNTYYCRVKVTDSANNSTVSNGFTIEVKSSAPAINIVSVVNKIIEFKVSCLTHDISKVDILLNNNVVKTYESGFNSSLFYEVDRNLLNKGKNAIQILATSTDGLDGYRHLEADKSTYNLPPVGTRVVIGDNDYTIMDAKQSGLNQVYTLEKNLISNVSIGQEIKINQDSVRVLCSLSNLESYQDFKEMKLVKIKKLKGQFEGYVEEKYELEGEGRYSSIKLETERFNNNVESEIIELQQYFDYMED